MPLAGFFLSRVSHVRDADGVRRRLRSPCGRDRRAWLVEVERAAPRWVTITLRIAVLCMLAAVVSMLVAGGMSVLVARGLIASASIGGPFTLFQVTLRVVAPVQLLAFVVIATMQLCFGSRAAGGGCLRVGCCAACGYDIGSLPLGTSGCVVCPECGAAWGIGSRAREPEGGE